MQTDPNWTNFLWNSKTRQVNASFFGGVVRSPFTEKDILVLITTIRSRLNWSILELRELIQKNS